MLYMSEPFHFNIPQQKFNIDNIYTSYCKIGNYPSSGYIGPDGSTAIDLNKHGSLIKAFSEIVERRALSLGSTAIKKEQIDVINLKKNITSIISKDYTSYSYNQEYPIDTTGTACHSSSNNSIYYALKELIEKNALFIFWYGKKGVQIENKDGKFNQNKLTMGLNNNRKNVIYFSIDYFYPLRVIFSFIVLDNYICSSGVGSSFCLMEAAQKALQEAYLLQWKDETLELVDSQNSTFKKKHENHSEYLSHLESYEKVSSWELLNDIQEKKTFSVSRLLEVLPTWIEDVYLIPLHQVIAKKVKCVKVFSPFMYNHIPIKGLLNLDNPMNRNTINLNYKHLLNLPDCTVL
ncbi:YcaO-like family protein [Paenibacillus tepidiphilus]|uniref:YcaO-like family protein n=1 Tax=Paenibacillus tepidiphilus TaxID=2608683 RepID=UPI0013A5904C|nr:YcaO-like family protein [Paenibacillus tepidiphilus]